MRLNFDCGGDGSRLIVLLHGLGATRHVWLPMLETSRWRGSWLAPDLRGHGTSRHADSYTLLDHANDASNLIRTFGPWSEIIIAGHSMGGAVALALASGAFDFTPSRVFSLGIKVAWSDEELTRLQGLPAAPARRFTTRDEAVDRYLKVAGLMGLIDKNTTAAAAGVVQDGDCWRLAYDPRTMTVGAPPMRALTDTARAPIHLARGEADRLVTLEQLRAYDTEAVDLMDSGHYAMVERPSAVWDWIESRLG
jgi:pimeloyl-ACP methyl ester carboxylesterase